MLKNHSFIVLLKSTYKYLSFLLFLCESYWYDLKHFEFPFHKCKWEIQECNLVKICTYNKYLSNL